MVTAFHSRALGLVVAVVAAAVTAACSALAVAPAGGSTIEPPPSPTSSRATSPSPEPTRTPTARRKPTPTAEPAPPGLEGDRRNAFAFAPLDDPGDVTVEGRVSQTQAWSTSKVLVVAAFLDTAVDGRPKRLSASDRALVEDALVRSDGDAVTALRDQIPGRPGPAMTGVLRSIGDRTTVAPDSYQRLMPWSVREQVRFMAALANGRVVSKAASAYLLGAMRPTRSHAWGLGTIDAVVYKGGWLRADTVTRQMGVVDGYAVAVITDGVGPAVRQSDGDSAHVRQLNRLAGLLEDRLRFEDRRRRR